MMIKIIDHGFILLTILFATYSQLVIRWQLSKINNFPEEFIDRLFLLVGTLNNLWILSGIISTFISGLIWMYVLSKFESSYAYPFTSLGYVVSLS